MPYRPQRPPQFQPLRSLRPPSIGTQASFGVPFLDGIPAVVVLWPNARLVVQMAFGAMTSTDLTNPSAWTDVTRDVMYLDEDTNAINISAIGRPDAISRAQPAACGFQLNNRRGSYSQGPQSPNYPNIVLNIPTRVGITLDGAFNTISWRFWGAAWSMKPSFDNTGGYAIVIVQAGGKLRQAQQSVRPALSCLRRVLTSPLLAPENVPLYYMPAEDGSAASQCISPSPNAEPLRIVGNVALGGVNGAPGSGMQPDYSNALGDAMRGTIPIPLTPVTRWRAQFAMQINKMDPTTDFINPVIWGDGTRSHGVSASNAAAGGVELAGDIVPGGFIDSGVGTDDGIWHEYRLDLVQSGANINMTAYLDGVAIITTTALAATVTPLIEMIVTADTPTASLLGSIGHFAVWETATTAALDTVAAMRGHVGENVIDRLVRLFGEDGVPLEVIGSSTTLMGAQGVNTSVELWLECAATDLGLLGDGRGPGMYYISRTARYNQPVTMSVDVGALADPLDPEGDDQKVRNKYTVTRKNGSTAIFEQLTGPFRTALIGTYDASPDGGDPNLSSDAQIASMAAFLTSLGTVEGYRYPSVGIDWRRPEAAPHIPEWLAMRPGGRMQITGIGNYVSQLPNEVIDVLAEGWSEQLSRSMWRSSPINCSPARPWNIAVLGPSGSPLILDLSSQSLAADLSPGDTTLSLKTDTGHSLFTTTATFPADFPVALNVGGWQVNCKSASGVASPQTLVIDPAPNTRIVSAGSPVALWRPPVLAL